MSPSLEVRENREFASELKFRIHPALAEQIREWARVWLAPDPHAGGAAGDGYRITSLYFDTEQFDVFHRRGSYGRSKLRIRRYGAGEVAFLERKLRTRGLVSKRRSIVRLESLDRLTETEPPSGWAGEWFQRRLQARRLQPVCQITYHRTARVAMTARGPIRLTLDDALQARPAEGLCFQEPEGETILEDQLILELKFCFELPVQFKNLVGEFALTAEPFSKYRLAAAALGLAATPTADVSENLLLQHA